MYLALSNVYEAAKDGYLLLQYNNVTKKEWPESTNKEAERNRASQGKFIT